MDTTQFHSLLRLSHIVAGSIGLILFWLPVLTTKGSRVHRVSGSIFAWLAYAVAATAAISCIWALALPISFTGIQRELSSQETELLSNNIRFFFAILATLMTWLVASVQLGVYCMHTKGGEDPTKTRVISFQYLAGGASMALLVYGLFLWYSGAGSRSFAAIGLGLFGTSDLRQTMRYFSDPSKTSKAWWYMHMECMLGAGIAFYTAFFVFGFSRLFDVQLQGVWAIIPWLIPAAIGVPATKIWINVYRQRFELESISAEAVV